MRLGYQISVDVEAHRRNLERHQPPEPVVVLCEVLEGEVIGWHQSVHQVRFTGPSETQYGWGPERAHARGTRHGASVWVFTASPVEYFAADGIWRIAP